MVKFKNKSNETEKPKKTYSIKFKIGNDLIEEPIENTDKVDISKLAFELSEKHKIQYRKIKSIVESQVKAIQEHIIKKKFEDQSNTELSKEADYNTTCVKEEEGGVNPKAEEDNLTVNPNTKEAIETQVENKIITSNNNNNILIQERNDFKANTRMIADTSKLASKQSGLSHVNNVLTHPSQKTTTYRQTKTFRFHQEFEKIKNIGDRVYKKSLVELERRRKNAERIKKEMDEYELKELKVKPVKSEYSTFLNFKLHYNLISADRRRVRKIKSSNKMEKMNSKNTKNNNSNLMNLSGGSNPDFNNALSSERRLPNKGSCKPKEENKEIVLEKDEKDNKNKDDIMKFSNKDIKNVINAPDLTFEENRNNTVNSKSKESSRSSKEKAEGKREGACKENADDDEREEHHRFKSKVKRSAMEVGEISNRLFREWESKIVKKQQLQEEYYRENCPFQPQNLVSTLSCKSHESIQIDPEQFTKRMQDWESKKKEKLSLFIGRAMSVNLTTGEELFKPNIGKPSILKTTGFTLKDNEERFKKGIFERLFSDKIMIKQKKEEETNIKMSEIKRESTYQIQDSLSKKINEDNKTEMFEEIFKVLNPQDERSITINEEFLANLGLDDNEKSLLKPLLKFFTESKQGYTHKEFIETSLVYFDKKMKYEDRLHIYSWHANLRKAKSPKKMREKEEAEKKKFTFKPEISENSKEAVENSVRYKNSTFIERNKGLLESKKSFIQENQKIKELEVMKKCSFKPNADAAAALNLSATKSAKALEKLAEENEIKEKDSDKDSVEN